MLHSSVYVLDYIPDYEKIHLVNRDVNVYINGPSLSVVEHQIEVSRGGTDTASQL